MNLFLSKESLGFIIIIYFYFYFYYYYEIIFLVTFNQNLSTKGFAHVAAFITILFTQYSFLLELLQTYSSIDFHKYMYFLAPFGLKNVYFPFSNIL